jgi:hypothetical protein
MAADTFERNYGITTAVNVVPSNGTDLPTTFTRGIYVGGTGALKVKMIDGTDVTFTKVLAGSFIPIVVSRVYSTGTTATNIIALK